MGDVSPLSHDKSSGCVSTQTGLDVSQSEIPVFNGMIFENKFQVQKKPSKEIL